LIDHHQLPGIQIHLDLQIYIDAEGMDSLNIRSVDGTEQIISFVEPLALPPPG
jgi:hypothetical protein